MNDLYETLGVNKPSNPTEIKKQYRKLSKKHHPDKGGNPKVFTEISIAYRILIDPRQKSHYDATGQIPKNKKATFYEKLTELFRDQFIQYINQRSIEELATTNIMMVFKGYISHNIKSFESQKAKLNKETDKLQRVLSRIDFKGKPNEYDVFKSVVDHSIALNENNIAILEEKIEFLKEALEYLDNYSYEFEIVRNMDEFDITADVLGNSSLTLGDIWKKYKKTP